jgi:hypothetical protein
MLRYEGAQYVIHWVLCHDGLSFDSGSIFQLLLSRMSELEGVQALGSSRI